MEDDKRKTSGFGIGEVGSGAESAFFDDMEAQRLQPKYRKTEMVKCSCGHTIPKSCVMCASIGSSCPDCYDRMSD